MKSNLLVNDRFESVPHPEELAGEMLQGTITDISSNGAFITLQGAIPPLLARLRMQFQFEGFGKVITTGFVMRRAAEPPPGLPIVARELFTGVGIVFVAMPLEIRVAVGEFVRSSVPSGLRALVVDDSPTMRGLIIDALYALEPVNRMAVSEASNGLEALKLLPTESFDIIIVDLHMPELDGFKLIDRISKIKALARVPILVITSDRNPESQERAMALGVDAYICKPIQKIQITEAVRDLLPGFGEHWLESGDIPDLVPVDESNTSS